MFEMNIDDVPFAELMARWVFQSDSSFGESGGCTKEESTDDSPDLPRASMERFTSSTWCRHFPKGWTKLPCFKIAEPLLARIFTVMATKYGRDWGVCGNAMKNWYRLGVEHAQHLTRAVVTLEGMKRPLVIYGRDGLWLFRAMQGLPHVYYAEGMSRRLCCSDPCRIRDYLKYCVRDEEALKRAVHVDTGFRGTVPIYCLEALTSMVVSPGYNPDDVRLLSYSGFGGKPWGLGYNHSFVQKLEHKPKLFFRSTRWDYSFVLNSATGQFVSTPNLRVTGDAQNASAFIVGVMAGSRILRDRLLRGEKVDPVPVGLEEGRRLYVC